MYSFSGFRGQHHSRPDPVPQDILDDVLPDPDDLADFELPDQQASIDAFLDGLCKSSDHEFRGLSHLLASLPDVLRRKCLIRTLYFHSEPLRKFGRRSLRLLHRDGTQRDRCKAEVCYIRSKYVIYYYYICHIPGLGMEYTNFINGIYQVY
jgi:hypothetical protein